MPSPALVKRRPFLMPIGILLALAATAACALALATWWLVTAPSLQIVVIPADGAPLTAEPAGPGRGTEPAPAGRDTAARAEALARMWADARSSGHIEAIYVGTGPEDGALVAPMAARLGLKPIKAEEQGARLAHRVLQEHAAERVLIVLPVDQVPGLLALSGESLAGPAGSDELFVVAIPRFGRATYLRLRYARVSADN